MAYTKYFIIPASSTQQQKDDFEKYAEELASIRDPNTNNLLNQNTTRLHFNSAGVYVLEYADGTKAGFSVYDRSEKSGRFTKIVGSDSSHTGAGVVIAEIG